MFCSFCGQPVVANPSSCPNCGKPLHARSSSNPVLIAASIILAITTMIASVAAVYYEREAAHLREAFLVQMVNDPRPPTLPRGAEAGPTTVAQPCEDKWIPGGVPNGPAGDIAPQTPASPGKTKHVPEPPLPPLQLISRGTPVYPPMAKMARIHGPVVVKALIDKQGRVARVCLISGHPMLAQAAVDAVRQWRYKPYRLNGEPVEIETTITVQFKLAQ